MQNRTIFAPITPVAMSAVGVIRISGERTFEVINKIFSKPLTDAKSHTAHHGRIMDGQRVLDDVVVTIFRAPNSYTGEDVCEIACHGSLYVLSALQKLLLREGCFLAEGGEFSKRAFLNGKMDILQAEAVIDLIEAESEREAQISLSRLKGGFSEKTERLRKELLDMSAQLLAYVDYPDDEIEELETEALRQKITESHEKLEKWVESYDSGRMIKNGVKICLVGKPNVGKSRLMNILSGYDRSIVTEIAGTTRDVVSENVIFGGVKLILSDTAGIHQTGDTVEKLGVEKSQAEIEKSDVVFCIFDRSRLFDKDDEKLLSLLSKSKKIAILNKKDLPEKFDKSALLGFDKTVEISAKTEEGIPQLEKALKEVLGDGFINENTEIIMNARQFNCILSAEKALLHAKENLMLTPDVLLIDIENALESLSHLSGKTVSEEIVENIFSRFCVGK